MKEIDISKHELVPRHEILTESQRTELLKTYGITFKQLPRILESDPMVKHLEANIGDIIKITRKSATAGQAEYYRIVIKG